MMIRQAALPPYSIRDKTRIKHESNMKNRFRYSSCKNTNNIKIQIRRVTPPYSVRDKARTKYESDMKNETRFSSEHSLNMIKTK